MNAARVTVTTVFAEDFALISSLYIVVLQRPTCRGRGKRIRGDASADQGHQKAMKLAERDMKQVAEPDILTPFRSFDDVMERLLPFHVGLVFWFVNVFAIASGRSVFRCFERSKCSKLARGFLRHVGE